MLKRKTRRKFRTNTAACEVLENRALLTGLDLSFGMDGFLNFEDTDGEFELTWDVEGTPDGGGIALTFNDLFETNWGLNKFDANGAIDTTWGDNGVAESPISASGFLPALETFDDGSTVISTVANGELTLARLLANGTLDTSFGTDGVTTVDGAGSFNNFFGSGTSVHSDSNGNIIVTGWSNDGSIAARLDSSGALDTSFGTDGLVALDDLVITGIEVGNDDTVYLMGFSDSGSEDLTVIHLNTDGSFDSGFGTDGITTIADTNILGELFLFYGDGIDVASDGSVGLSLGSSVAILNPDGTLDTTFDEDGIVALDVVGNEGASAIAFDVIFDGNDRLYASVYVEGDFTTDTFGEVRRFNDDGSTDDTFPSEDGVNSFTDQAFIDLDLSSNGDIYAGGVRLNSDAVAQAATVARFTVEQDVDISDIVAKIESLDLRHDRHLLSHLRNAERFLEQGRPRQAMRQLRQVMHHIRHAVRRGRISVADGECLLGMIDQVRDNIREEYGNGRC